MKLSSKNTKASQNDDPSFTDVMDKKQSRLQKKALEDAEILHQILEKLVKHFLSKKT